MNDLGQAQAIQPRGDFGYVQAAHRRAEEMRTSEAVPLEPPTLGELQEALGEPVQRCELWVSNWRNRIYRVELASGVTLVAKQVVVGTDAMVLCQYDQLHALASLKIPKLRLPKAMALLGAKRLFVMELAQGRTIQALTWKSYSRQDLVEACELAGKILARMHSTWTEKICSMPVEALARDLAATPWHLSTQEQRILQASLARLATAEVTMGQVYYDYKPANLLYHNGQLTLIDPPEMLWQGVHLWDFSLFRSFMRRELWKFGLRHPFGRRRAIIRQAIAAFERGYLSGFAKPHPDPILFALATRFFELQRVAQLITMQTAKVAMARLKMPLVRDGRLGNPVSNRLSLPLLEWEKSWLFRQLDRAIIV
jgi:Ser/Thr protein kinase RdoA (MazF antagonist)